MSAGARETAGVTTRLIVAYVRRHVGEEAVPRLLGLAGESRPVAELEDETTWSTYATKIALFDAAAQLTGDPDVARHIGEAVLVEQLAAIQRLMIGALGSPQRVLRSVAGAQAKFSTSATMEAIDVKRGRALVTYRLHDGYVPSRHDCLYTQGILSQAPVLFGLPAARISHAVCQVEGAAECRYEVRWQQRRWRHDRAANLGVGALRERMLDLERTVADLVSPRDLDDILRSVGSRARSAIGAQRHLLAVRIADGAAPRIHGSGLSDDAARTIGERLLAHDPASGEPPAQLVGHAHVVAEVASALRRYGWIAAYQPADAGFLPGEQEHLDAYAKLAAAALDVSSSLEEARERGAMSEALLELGQQIAAQSDELSIAQKVAEAVPAVVGADRASLYLWDAPTGTMRSAAVHRFGHRTDEARSIELPLAATPALDEMLTDPRPRTFADGSDDPWIDQLLTRFDHALIVVAPVVRDELLGLVVAAWSRDSAGPASRSLAERGLASLADQAGLAIANQRSLAQTRHLATHDQLTGLARPSLFTDRVEQALAETRRTGRSTAVLFLDLDDFKPVNDTFGHPVGDEVLRQVAARIGRTVRESDGVARLGGDEFAILVRQLSGIAAAERVATDVIAALREPFEAAGERLYIGASIGIAYGPEHGETAGDLLKSADAAMYEAKAKGDTYRTFVAGEER